nr:tRNA (adenosine(37)-N6)-dimethylallyltransferase MiaA [Microlunatus panaciterrae]
MVGPTAAGKSSLAVALARRLGQEQIEAEIVNADSMLVYRGMDIGTAKPTAAERDGVPHHLIDILDITQTATVAEFQALARAAIADCRRRGVRPIVVGGSALYVRAIVDAFEFPGTDPAVRAALEADLAADGPHRLHARLQQQDPAAAAAILPGNGRRIVRALEVIALTGRAFSVGLPGYRYQLPDVLQIGLDIERDLVDQRISDRVDRMWGEGFVTEVIELERRGLRSGVTASRALGYRQILDFLSGSTTEDEARMRTVAGTRRFSRKQGGWFRRDPRIRWVSGLAPDLLDQVWRVVGENGPELPAQAGMEH